MRSPIETPKRLVEDGKITAFGVFDGPFRELNLVDAAVFGYKRRIPRAAVNLRLKEWQHFGVINEDFYFGFAVVNAKYLGNSFCYFFNRKTRELVVHESMTAPGLTRVPAELWQGECSFRGIGYRVEIHNRLEKGYHRASIDIKQKKENPGVRAELEFTEDLESIEPLVVVSPVRENRPLYTHKAAFSVEGRVRVGSGEPYELDPSRDIALMDVQRTFYPYRTFWNWATCAGYDDRGRLVALNLCRNFIEDDERYNENCLWVDGRISYLGAARFDFDKGNVLEHWHIETTDGRCVVDMKPEGERQGKVMLGVLKDDFHQPFGKFDGTVEDSEGKTHKIEDYYGVTEHHVARW